MSNEGVKVMFGKGGTKYADAKYKAAKLTLKEHGISSGVLSPRNWCKMNNVNYSVGVFWVDTYCQYVDDVLSRAYPW
jgi:hypothetical protein